MMPAPIAMATLELQDVTHQLVQQFIAELQEMLDDLSAGALTDPQKKLVSKIVTFFDKEMKEHHFEEERRIFPVLLARGDAALGEKVRALQADHEELRTVWQELKQGIELAMQSSSGDAKQLHADFDRYSACFARHLVLEESIQFSPEHQTLFQRWGI